MLCHTCKKPIKSKKKFPVYHKNNRMLKQMYDCARCFWKRPKRKIPCARCGKEIERFKVLITSKCYDCKLKQRRERKLALKTKNIV